jgi:tetratricopeptide (TPR) repeat protein
METKGRLAEGVLPGLLRDLYVGRKTGLLTFARGEERRSVRVRHGHLVNADSNVREERMGDRLVRRGALTEGDLKRALGFMIRDQKRLGQVLIELGLLDEDGLEDAVAGHVHDILAKVFTWTEGDYEFHEQEDASRQEGEVTLKLSTGDLILEAARGVQDPDVVRYALGDLDRVVGLSSDPLLRFQRINLSPTDGYVLSRVDGTLSAREVTQLIPLPVEETQKSLFGLLSTGVVEFLPLPPRPRPAVERAGPKGRVASALPGAGEAAAPAPAPPPPVAPPPPAPPPVAAAAPETPAAADARRQEIFDAFDALKTRTHFEVLGVAREATEAQVKEAYFRMAKRFHPDVHHDPALSDLREKLEAVFIRLGDAYEVLRNPRIRASYEKALDARASRPSPSAEADAAAAGGMPISGEDPAREIKMAEEAIRKAARSIATEKYWEAIQLLEPAVGRVEGKARQTGRVLLAKAYMKNPNWVKQGEELLLAVLQDDPKHLESYLLLGNIYKTGGLRSRAVSMFRKVLDLTPDHDEALAQLAELTPEEPEPGPGGGIIKKIFGRS